ncbi:hypothetical protein KEM54_003406 [Ascosphaera aggregata]|nr:hypothetical protein KEM54_003406 [Ascosphaera aggregata]
MYEYNHPAYRAIEKIGKEITSQVKPQAVVVLSGHWQGKKDELQVNTAEKTDLIYDFYGFPSHYYKEKYPSIGSKKIAEKVINAVQAAGLKISGVKRGLDHGVWTSFKIAFDQEENPLNVPVVQLSLYGNEDPSAHFKLGTALAPLRDQNILIVSSGMAVHNLRDYMFSTSARPLPYTVSFDNALKEAASLPFANGVRERAMVELVKRPDARSSHPSMDHLMPFHVAAGAAVEDEGRQVFTFLESSMSWAQYRWGDVPARK